MAKRSASKISGGPELGVEAVRKSSKVTEGEGVHPHEHAHNHDHVESGDDDADYDAAARAGDDDDGDDDDPRFDAEQIERDELLGVSVDHDDDDDIVEELGGASGDESPPDPLKGLTRRAEGKGARVAQQKRKRSGTFIPVRFDVAAYRRLELGVDGPPDWWVEQDLANDLPTYEKGRKDLEECFRKRIEQAREYEGKKYDSACPLRRDILAKLLHKSWTAEKFADVFMSGMCRYRQWLTGLGRAPNAKEIRGIPRATSQQLAMFAVYTDML